MHTSIHLESFALQNFCMEGPCTIINSVNSAHAFSRLIFVAAINYENILQQNFPDLLYIHIHVLI